MEQDLNGNHYQTKSASRKIFLVVLAVLWVLILSLGVGSVGALDVSKVTCPLIVVADPDTGAFSFTATVTASSGGYHFGPTKTTCWFTSSSFVIADYWPHLADGATNWLESAGNYEVPFGGGHSFSGHLAAGATAGTINVHVTYTDMNGDAQEFVQNVRIVRGIKHGVGGIEVRIDKLALLAPYIDLTATILGAAAASTVYVKRVRHRKEKQ